MSVAATRFTELAFPNRNAGELIPAGFAGAAAARPESSL